MVWANTAAGMGAALNQVRAFFHSYINRIDAKAWFITARIVIVAVAASDVSKESRAAAAKKRRVNLKMRAAERQLRLERTLAISRSILSK